MWKLVGNTQPEPSGAVAPYRVPCIAQGAAHVERPVARQPEVARWAQVGRREEVPVGPSSEDSDTAVRLAAAHLRFRHALNGSWLDQVSLPTYVRRQAIVQK